MEIKLDILQNSIDYVKQSIELADIADEFGNHDKEKSNNDSKVKWKLSFICLVQAFELLAKGVLTEINTCLVYKDIDKEIDGFSKTINLSLAIRRLTSFSDIQYTELDINLINKAIRFRNEFIHYDVKLYTEELKVIYCRLLKLYTRTYTYFIENDFFLNANNSRGYGNFMHFADWLVPFRGAEVRKDELSEIKKEIKENQKYHVYVENGNEYKRVIYGKEKELFPELFDNERDSLLYEYKYCDECMAQLGEYHGERCDLEICPKCKGQRLSCNCFEKYHYDTTENND
ncbi:MAG: hypothetical protein R3Y24_00090 [Eubacteriales bacterium]